MILRMLTLWVGITLSAFSGADSIQMGVEHLLKKQDPSGGFFAPIETSTMLYSAQVIYLYRYLDIAEQKKSRIEGLVKSIQQHASKGFSIYPGGPEQTSLVQSARLAYDASGLNVVSSEQKQKLGATDLFVSPYLMLFNLDQNHQCLTPQAFKWMIKNDSRIPWIKVLSTPMSFIFATQGTKSLENSTFKTRSSLCPRVQVSQEEKAQLAQTYIEWFKSYVSADGTIFDYIPTTIPNIMALHHANTILGGRADIQELINLGINTLEEFQISKEDILIQTAGEGSITETVEMLHLMLENGMSPLDPRFQAGLRFVLERQHSDGGWGFSAHNIHFPDPDGTGLVLNLLNKVQEFVPTTEVNESIQSALAWLVTRNNPDGGFASWDRKQDMLLIARLATRPLSNRGIVLAESLEEATSRVLIGMAPHRFTDPKIYRSWKNALKWLLNKQAKDGSFPGTWMIGKQFGTASAISALATAVNDPSINQIKLMRTIEKGLAFITSNQKSDGSFGEHPSVYDSKTPLKLEKSSPAFTGIIASRLMQFNDLSNFRWSEEIVPVLNRSAQFLKKTMNAEGKWGDDTWTAVTFPKVEYARYDFIQELEGLRVLLYLQSL